MRITTLLRLRSAFGPEYASDKKDRSRRSRNRGISKCSQVFQSLNLRFQAEFASCPVCCSWSMDHMRSVPWSTQPTESVGCRSRISQELDRQEREALLSCCNSRIAKAIQACFSHDAKPCLERLLLAICVEPALNPAGPVDSNIKMDSPRLSARAKPDAKLLENQSSMAGWSSRLAVDAAAATTAAVAVSPVMTVIDRAVVEAAAGQCALMASVRSCLKQMFRQPHKFAAGRPFGAMLLLYVGTYFTANAIDTISSHHEGLPADKTTSSTTKLCAVTGINVGLALNKDGCFARSFGTAATRSRALPPISYVPFLVRDGITLFATFNLPGMVAPSFPEEVEKYMSRLSTAQLLMPAASQFMTTPLHLLGLDLYYRNGKLGFWERVKASKKAWLSTSLARACRIIPAYGIGGIVNNDSRAYLMKRVG